MTSISVSRLPFPRSQAFDPIAATDPLNDDRLAVVYEYGSINSPCAAIVPGVSYSRDGGITWRHARGSPWAGSGRIPNWHASIAWGPGPEPGKTRLYWVDTTVSDCSYSDHRLSVAYSDNLGTTWSPLFVYRRTPATAAGGYPDIAVDRNPASPNYGTVYATINWFPAGSAQPGLRVIASTDYGVHWTGAEVEPLPAPAAYPFQYRIGAQLHAAPDGGVYVTFCQRDRTSPSGATGRLEYGVARLDVVRRPARLVAQPSVLAVTLSPNGYNLSARYAPGTADRTRLGSCWSHGFEVEPASGRIFVAVSDYRTNMASPASRGVIVLAISDDHGKTWRQRTLPSLAQIDGRAQSAHKPTLAVRGSFVFVGFHTLTDVNLGTRPTAVVSVGAAFTLSTDGGTTFSPPEAVSQTRWNPDWLDHARQGAGLRDRADITANGSVFWAYGDGSRARAWPDRRWGRCVISVLMVGLD